MNAPDTNIAKREQGPVAAFSNFMDKLKPQLALALPKHMNADRMARLALTAFSSNTKLQACTPKSIAGSLMTAGQLGLEPGVNGAGFLVPYGTTCTFVPGWKGLVDLVARSGRGTVYTGVIFSDQRYNFTDGAKRDLLILNETDLDAPEDITHAYAIGWVRDASMPIIELWSIGKIKKHRDKYNKVGKAHYSFRDWEMYARKVPLLQVLKYMPASVELANAIALANAEDSGHGATIENGIVIEMDDDSGNSEKREVEPYPEDKFAAAFAKDQALIVSGKKTADDLIAMYGAKHPLTDAQIAAIRAVKKVGEAPEMTMGQQIEKNLLAAKDMDVLDTAADLIAELADPAERQGLSALYAKRKAELEGE